MNPCFKKTKSLTAPRMGALLLALVLSTCGGGGDSNNSAAVAAALAAGSTTSPATTPPAAVAAASDVTCIGYDQKTPMTVSAKTITIVNNSQTTIYPVLSTSKNQVNQWVQACKRVVSPNFPTKYVYKLYINEGVGIPANSSVTLTLPLYSQLDADNYITWWNGGRVVMADSNVRLRDSADTKISGTPTGLSCTGDNTACQMNIYSSDVQFPENIFAQLTEYTFGASIIPAGQPTRLLVPDNVGYNISYVDHVYLPIVMAPKGNPYIGFTGTDVSMDVFSNTLKNFLATTAGDGWPVYNLNDKYKLPGGYNVFAQRLGVLPVTDDVPVKVQSAGETVAPVLTLDKCRTQSAGCTATDFGTSVQRMQNLWGSCATGWSNADLAAYVTQQINCPVAMQQQFQTVKDFFKTNYDNYVQLRNSGSCDATVPMTPFSYWEVIKHIYGWVPFNEGCGADANKLDSTTFVDGNGKTWTHALVQPMYIHEMQYNYQTVTDPNLVFNPYVPLIHDQLKMNAYAFSVDDAVGFMSELGTGLVIGVGGTSKFDNPLAFDYSTGFTLNVGVPLQLVNTNTQLIKNYQACTGPDNKLSCGSQITMPSTQIAGFRIGTVPAYPVTVRFSDMNDNAYSVKVQSNVQSQFDACPGDKSACIAAIKQSTVCSVTRKDGTPHPKSSQWCDGINPNQAVEKQVTQNYLSYSVTADYLN